MTEDKTLKELRFVKATLKGKLTRFGNFLDNLGHDQSNSDQLHSRINSAENLLNEFNAVYIQLLNFDETNQDKYESEFVDFENKFYEYLSRAHKMNKKLNVNIFTTSSDNSEARSNSEKCNIQQRVNLPTINLPTFDGNPEKWLQFFDTFNSLIHEDANLNKIQKFYYLKSCLKASAESVISSLTVTNDNYDIAWSILKERFQNDKMIIHSYVRALFELPIIQKESSISLRKMVDEVNKILRVLKSFNQHVEEWSTLLIYLLSSKLDHNSKRQWETEHINQRNLPNLNQFLSFLSQRCLLLETLHSRKDIHVGTETNMQSRIQKTQNQTFFNQTNEGLKCYFCKDAHAIFYCTKFLSLSIKDRNTEIQKLKLCSNCLRSNHTVHQCKSSGCRICKKNHNTLLHYSNVTKSDNQSNHQSNKQLNKQSSHQSNTRSNVQTNNPSTSHFINYSNSQSSSNPNQSNQSTNDQSSYHPNTQPEYTTHLSNNTNPLQSNSIALNCYQFQTTHVLLATAMVNIFDNFGNIHQARALLDSGSQSNFISSSLCKKLNLSMQSINLPVTGINHNITQIKFATHATIKSRINSYQIDSSFLVLDKITENLPTVEVNIAEFIVPKNIVLADNTFYLPGKIDLLLGASIFYDLLCIGQIQVHKKYPIIQKTKFGWIITGNIPFISKQQSSTICNFSTNNIIQEQLKKFWEIENIDNAKVCSKEEEECEAEFIEQMERSSDGNFIVPLLTKNNIKNLGDSYQTALNRFYYTEKKLKKNIELKTLYVEFMKEYQTLGHMEPVNHEDNSDLINYLPHHGVLKLNNTTTKLRVVFDGSAKTSSGLSLNDCLKVGPTIQLDLLTILIKFRTFNIVFAADIEKMYRQVIVKREHQNLQRILWRQDQSEEIQHFKLKRVTYGTSSAPYLAIRSLIEVANQNQGKYPEASQAIKEGFYVDDLLYGADTIETAKQLKQDLQIILEEAGFTLRKWISNQSEIFSDQDLNQTNVECFISNKEENKTLGIHWHSKQDILYYQAELSQQDTRITKKNILSTIARIFDPLGLVGPYITQAKIILQQLWKLNIDWNESLPNEFHTSFLKFIDQLSQLNKICIPRHVILPNATNIQLHGFCDASQLAYGACVYILSSNENNSQVRLLCAKSKVAPIKCITIPKLELCAATVLAHLVEKVIQSVNIEYNKIIYWTDSTIVLSWLKGEPHQWKPFVSNRVAQIQAITKINEWRHVISKDNPADLISRGSNIDDLTNSTLWWNGPQWLSNREENWPKTKLNASKDIPEAKKQSAVTSHLNINYDFDITQRYSLVTKLQRVVAFIFRFKYNCLNKLNKLCGPLTIPELTKSLNCIIQIVQMKAFKDDIICLNNNKSINKSSKLVSLNPIIDNGILKVGGRIKNAPLLELNQKHPIILPSSHHFTECLIREAHYKQLHAGPQSLLSTMRTKYWIISGLTTVKKVLRKCIVCFRNKPLSVNQLMGDLPKERITPSRVFSHTGLDYCGPFNVKSNKLRYSKIIQIYVCIFVCFSTKATHLEIISDLTTDSFLNCLKRFMSRRGKPSTLYSDNATTFVGAINRLKDVYKFVENSKIDIQNFLFSDLIHWQFIPARSPHYGGIWEAAVKSFKFHLKRVIGNHIFSLENFATLTIQIEACLNSRPLTPLSSDPSDLQVLTPAHFLIFSALTSIPEHDLREEKTNQLNTYQHMTQTLQHFWSRWSTEYISQLQTRTKWRQVSQHKIEEGQLVIIKEENLAPLHWKMGRISKIYHGEDGHIRVVSIKTVNGEIKRAISKICLLPTN